MPRFKIVNDQTIQLTEAEETARDAEEAQAVIDAQVEADEKSAADAKLASGKAKLKDLGLDDDEVKQIVGI